MSNIIELKNITKKYDLSDQTLPVLDDLSFQFKTGYHTAILGSSGSGKTTVLNLIGGVDSDFEGELLFNGVKITDFDQYRRENISFIFQDLNLIPHLSLIKNITIGLTNEVHDKESKALDLLDKVGLKEHASKKPHQLSGGERQRVAIARALARDTDVLLCDEPTGNLDSQTKKEIMDLIVDVFQSKTIIFITHDKTMAETYADVIVSIEDRQLKVIETLHIKKPKEIILKSKSKRTFKLRFEFNMLSRKLSIINASYLLIIIASIFIFGTGIIQGVEREIDDYLYDKHKVDLIDVFTPRFTINGFRTFIEDYNTNFDGTVSGFMTGLNINTNFEGSEEIIEHYAFTLNPSIRPNLETDIVAGHYPESNNEILFSKAAAVKKISDYSIFTGDKKSLESIKQLSDEELLSQVQAMDISFKNYTVRGYLANSEDQYYDNDFDVVGIIDDSKYSPSRLAVYSKYGQRRYIEAGHNIYILEDEIQNFILEVYIGYNDHRFEWYRLFIEEPNLDLREATFNSFLTHKNLVFGKDNITSERALYYKEVHGYKVAILGACIILSIFAILSIYNGIRTNIQRNRRNIGIYKSLGYTSNNIKSMFLFEGIMLTLFITLSTIACWFVINLLMNEHILKALDPHRIIEVSQMIHLNLYAVFGVIFAIVFTILISINKELKRVNIINLLRG